MSKSLTRVKRALDAAALPHRILEVGDSRTAEAAAAAVGCALDQIVKSIAFHAPGSDVIALFLTAGGNRVDPARASATAGEALARADAALIRARTGFAIGGVSPIGHLTPPRIWMDPRLLEFETVWAAAGTPRHMVALDARDLHRLTGATVADFCQETPAD